MRTAARNDDVSVIVPADSTPSTVACVRSLGGAGVNTIVVSTAASTTAFASRFCDEAVVLPDPMNEPLEYRDALLDLASRPDVRTIVPTREIDAYLLARYADLFADRVSLVTPPLGSLERVHDRLQLAAAAESAGVSVPETRPLDEVDDWTPARVVKSRYNILTDAYLDSYSPDEVDVVDGIGYVPPGGELDDEALRAAMQHAPVVQEFVPAEDEYMVGALYDRGDAVATFQHRQVRGTSYLGSGGAYRESVAIPELEDASRTLLDHLDWHGLACLEYRRDENTGEFTLMEINPRMWQSLSATVSMGADFPRYYWLLASGLRDEIDPDYDVGVGCHWLKGELLYAASLFLKDSPVVEKPSALETVRDVASSCYRQPNFDHLRRTDPAPFVQDWLNLLAVVPHVPRLPVTARPVREVTPTERGAPSTDRENERRARDGDGDERLVEG